MRDVGSVVWAWSYLPGILDTPDLGHSAINTDLADVHEAGVVGSEKQSRRCDLLRASELLARNSRPEIFLRFCKKICKNVVARVGWAEYIHTNSAFCKLDRTLDRANDRSAALLPA